MTDKRLSLINRKKVKPTNRDLRQLHFDTIECIWLRKTPAQKAYARTRRRRNVIARRSRKINRQKGLAK